MNDLFSSLLHRHKGTCDVVKPRSRSRFETDTTNFTTPFNPSDADEPGEEHIDSLSLAQIPEHPLPNTKDMDINPLQIDLQESRHVDQPLPLDPKNGNRNHKPLIQPAPDISSAEKFDERKIEPLADTPVRDEHRRAHTRPSPVGRTTIVERHQRSTAEVKHRLDGNLDSQISAMLDRIENLRSAVSEPQEKSYASERRPSDEKGHAGDTLDELKRRSRQQVPSKDDTERTNGSNKNGPMQTETASHHRQWPQNTLLTPPSWFSEMQAQSILQKKPPNGEPSPEPVINVSIGRIEVKATKMQETPRIRKPQKPSGVMSLEKYLRQSGRGGHR